FLNIAFPKVPTPAGVSVVQKMHDRYASTWYSSLSFTELAEQRGEDGKMTKDTWWEEGRLPGKLRIDIGTTATDTVKPHRTDVYVKDTAYVKAPGQSVRRVARRNMLLILGFDIYRQPVDRTIAQITAEGFDLTHVGTDTWHNRPVTTIGTGNKQIWIDT